MSDKQTTECPLCLSNAHLIKDDLFGYQEPSKFNVFICPDCDTSFYTPQSYQIERIYEIIYDNAEKIPGYDRYCKYAEEVKIQKRPLEYLSNMEETYWAVCESLKSIVYDRQSVTVLEIGSGLGYLTFALNRAGYNTMGIDASRAAVAQANSRYGNYFIYADIYEYSLDKSSLYDVIILTEVIEHIVEPERFLNALSKLLKPGGHIILTTPNKSFFPDDVIWFTDLPPVHCWWFSEKSIQFLASKLNLKTEFISFKNFYKKHPKQYDLNELRGPQLLHPVLDKDGKIIAKNSVKQPHLIKKIILQLPFARLINCKIKELIKPDIITCSDRGTVICAVMKNL